MVLIILEITASNKRTHNFPEVNFDKVDKIRGLDITIVTSNKTKQGTLELLKEFNFPITEKKENKMAKKSAIQKNLKRIKMVNKFEKKELN